MRHPRRECMPVWQFGKRVTTVYVLRQSYNRGDGTPRSLHPRRIKLPKFDGDTKRALDPVQGTVLELEHAYDALRVATSAPRPSNERRRAAVAIACSRLLVENHGEKCRFSHGGDGLQLQLSQSACRVCVLVVHCVTKPEDADRRVLTILCGRDALHLPLWRGRLAEANEHEIIPALDAVLGGEDIALDRDTASVGIKKAGAKHNFGELTTKAIRHVQAVAGAEHQLRTYEHACACRR
eukprot:CAMPEP_0185170572 /NCGR_PEP_ID=MMETSP1139-20130426/18922_1 /TAXON_ID=298111 /ORGANISM="Pavlova sp., Strain CCMP459" /LENGTH=237 /DNA_ID=CAMNT_0027736139 /DNA_START=288 /DNA_END=1000 /DNA_ORIENTATION=+